MDPLRYLKEEHDSVRTTLRETLRHDFGPDRTHYFEECEARLDLIKRAIERRPPMGAEKISDTLRELGRIAVRVALIERSHLGEFFWPFTDVLRRFAEELFREEELFDLDPVTHVVAEGAGYQVVDDPVSRQGSRRILVIAFPRQLKHHVLIHAIFGHELGHPAARTDDPGAIAQDVLENMKAGPLLDAASAERWLKTKDAPAAVAKQLKEQPYSLPHDEDLKAWRTEVFCDLFGLYLFGPAFAAAHRAALEPSSSWPEKFVLGSATHPPYPIRRRVITSAMRLLKWHIPQTTETDGAAHIAETRFLEYAAKDDADSWYEVYPDHLLKGILNEIEKVFQPHSEIMYKPPKTELLVNLLDQLSLARPPIVERVDDEGYPVQEKIELQQCLYAGWIAWIGRDELRCEKLLENPRLKELTFLEINRLCAQGILQQRAIDTVADWRRNHPREEEVPALEPPRVGPATSGGLGRSALIRRIQTQDLLVSPLLSAQQIGASSIDLRMGNVVLIVRARGSSHVDPGEAMRRAQNAGHEREAQRQQKHERYELKFKTPFLLHPGTLALVPTLEWVSLPEDLMGSVTARSTWAREGLSIATATMIEPGYQGIVTLELANLGEIPIALYPGLELAQISFFDVVGSTRRPHKGQFELSFEPQQGNVAKESEYPFLPEKQDEIGAR